MSLAEDILDSLVETYAPREADFEQWDLDALKREVSRVFAVDTARPRLRRPDRGRDPRRAVGADSRLLRGEGKAWSAARCWSASSATSCCRSSTRQWKDHLYSLDHLKEGIGLRGYGQRDPLIEYKKESFELFQAMKERVDEEIVQYLWWLRPMLAEDVPQPRRPAPRRVTADPEQSRRRTRRRRSARCGAARSGAAPPSGERGEHAAAARRRRRRRVKTVRRDEPKVGRNDPCPCGSGKKYKKCHGAAA